MSTNSKLGPYTPEHDEALERLRSALLARLDETPHLTSWDVMAYVDNEASPAEAEQFRSHIASCPQCAAQVEEMRDIDAGLADVVLEQEQQQSLTPVVFKSRRTSFWHLGGVAFAAACVALLGFVVSHLLFVNSALRQAATSKQYALDTLQGQLAHREAADTVIKAQQRLIAQKEQQVAEAQGQAQRLKVQLNALQKKPSLPPANLVAQQHQNPKNSFANHDDNDKIAVNTPAKHLISPLDRAVQVALLQKSLPLSKDYQASMIGSNGLQMGEAGAKSTFNTLSPVGTNLLTESPVFKWTPAENATSYEVVVQDENGHVVADSKILNGSSTNEWQTPNPLPRGQVLHWTVTAYSGSTALASAPDYKTRPPSLFFIFGKEQVEAIKKQASPVADSPKELAVLYAQYHLLDDVEREVRAWKMANPASQDANLWLNNLQAYRTGVNAQNDKKHNTE